jgi:hypothetical protein
MNKYNSEPDYDHRYFVYDPLENESYFFETEKTRDDFVKKTIIPSYQEDGEWVEPPTGIVVGFLTHIVEEIMSIKRPNDSELEDGVDSNGNYWGDGIEDIVDYELASL